jgi:hypothetical protein
MVTEGTGKIDLEEIAREGNIRASNAKSTYFYEDSDVRKHRLEQAGKDAQLRRVKDGVLFGVAIMGALALAGICIFFILTTPPEDKRWGFATPILISMFTGFIGYLTGSKASSVSKPSEAE